MLLYVVFTIKWNSSEFCRSVFYSVFGPCLIAWDNSKRKKWLGCRLLLATSDNNIIFIIISFVVNWVCVAGAFWAASLLFFGTNPFCHLFFRSRPAAWGMWRPPAQGWPSTRGTRSRCRWRTQRCWTGRTPDGNNTMNAICPILL